MADLTMTTQQSARVDVQPVDKNGKPAAVASPPTFDDQPKGVVELTPAPDGTNVTVRGLSADINGGQVTVTANGVSLKGNPLSNNFTVEVTKPQGPEATSFRFTFNPPIDVAPAADEEGQEENRPDWR